MNATDQNAVAAPQHPGRSLADYLQTKAQSLDAVMPDNFGMDVDRLIRLAISVCSRNAKLLECSQSSIYSAIYDAVRWGIDPVSPHGFGYLVPRWNKHSRANEASFQIGYKGLIHLARRFGCVTKVSAHVVLDGEAFSFDPVESDISHEYNWDLDRTDESKYRAVYAVAWTEDGYRAAVVLGRAQVEARRAAGSTKGGMWDRWPDRMWRKTAIRSLFSGGDIELAPGLVEVLEHDYQVDRDNERGVRVVDSGNKVIDAALGLADEPEALGNTEEPEAVAAVSERFDGEAADLPEGADDIVGEMA